MAAYHVNIVQRNAPNGCAAKFNLGEGEVPVRGNRGLRAGSEADASTVPNLPWRSGTSAARPWVGSQRASDVSRGGVISPLRHRQRGETVTPPRFALRFASCEPILPLQGRMGTVDAARPSLSPSNPLDEPGSGLRGWAD